MRKRLELGARSRLPALEGGKRGVLEVPGKTRKSGQALLTHMGLSMKPHEWLELILGPFGVGTTTGELGLTLTHHTPGLGVSPHLTPYSILCDTSWGWHPNGHFVPGLLGLPRGTPEIPPSGTPATLKPYNSRSRAQIDLPSKAKL
jgi:hypothetical protein